MKYWKPGLVNQGIGVSRVKEVHGRAYLLVTSNNKIEMVGAAEIARQSDRRRFDIGGETECQRGRG